MFIQALAGFSLLLTASIQPGAIHSGDIGAPEQMTTQEKRAAMQPLVQSATDCVARVVAADPRLGDAKFTDLIVDSFSSCAEPVRTLIDAHDRHYGVGTGELFFMGPYLDALPSTVNGIVHGRIPNARREPDTAE